MQTRDCYELTVDELTRVLMGRRERILRRWLLRLSFLADPASGQWTTIDLRTGWPGQRPLRLHLADGARVIGLERPDVENPEPP